jgi:6,7-dimethyl-8-ribityllumazine synthase
VSAVSKDAGYAPPRAADAARPDAPAGGGHRLLEGSLDGQGLAIAIVAARFNGQVCDRLLEGALDALARQGTSPDRVTVVRVPGAFEIPFAARRLALSRRYDAIVGLGAVIRGETPHFDYVAGEAARGIATAAVETGVPVLFGVLTTESVEQAMERSGGKRGNRGADAALAAIEMARLARLLDAEGERTR